MKRVVIWIALTLIAAGAVAVGAPTLHLGWPEGALLAGVASILLWQWVGMFQRDPAPKAVDNGQADG
jgi:hypothetical protein